MSIRIRAAAVAATVAITGTATVGALVATGTRALHRLGSPVPDPSDGVVLLCCALGCAVVLWLVLAVLAGILAEGAGAAGRIARSVADLITPLAIRRFTALATGAAIGLAAAAPATAAPGGVGGIAGIGAGQARPTVSSATYLESGRSVVRTINGPGGSLGGAIGGSVDPAGAAASAGSAGSAGSTDHASLDPGFRPTRPVARVATPTLGSIATPLRVTSAQSQDPQVVVVRRGDTLWDIAARDLAPGAGAAQIAAAWPRWYEANRHVIGDNPDLLYPGQQLVRPEAGTGAPAHLSNTDPSKLGASSGIQR